MEKNKTYPNFIIAGAPKCGTTSLYHYLQQHPGIFFAPKEIHFFGKDLRIKNQLSDFSTYLNFFKNADDKIKGDASVWYLYSTSAPKEIMDQIGKVKIIICLRNPAEMIYSLHKENLFNADETETDFEEALALEFYRKVGQKIPTSARFNQCLMYRNNGLYSDRINNYINTFGEENIHFVLADDLKKQPLEETNKVLRFLGASPLASLAADMQNTSKSYASLSIHQKFKTAKNWEKNLIRILLPSKNIREKILNKIYTSNIQKGGKEAMSDEVKKELTLFFSDDIKKTAKLIHRDLNHWL
ncbi:MAG: sulfotransferase domain-containing protein [Bacteroidetes bacterium]|nr:sulfotransferase domain-containing protein [Bacteroidota bacterium]